MNKNISSEQLKWLSEQLTKKHAAYNVTIINQDGHEEEVQGNFHEDVEEFYNWIQEMIKEIDWPTTQGILRFNTSYKVIAVEFDHYLADEGAEDKAYSGPGWMELPMITIFVPGKNQIIQISEGDGSNLSSEDKERGIVDYIYYSQYNLADITDEVDGGQIDQREYLRDKYSSLTEVITEVLDFAYDNAYEPYVLLSEDTPAYAGGIMAI